MKFGSLKEFLEFKSDNQIQKLEKGCTVLGRHLAHSRSARWPATCPAWPRWPKSACASRARGGRGDAWSPCVEHRWWCGGSRRLRRRGAPPPSDTARVEVEECSGHLLGPEGDSVR
jgi:hypothetical protein